MPLPPIFRTQPEATLLGPGSLLSCVFAQLSEDKQHNIKQNAWLAILRGHGETWRHEIRIRGEGVHILNLCQLEEHVTGRVNTWAFDFTTGW